MPPLKTIALHIGPHKTGSTYIQSQIRHHHHGLQAAGWAVLGGPTDGVKLPPNASFFLRRLLNHEAPGLAMPPVLQGLDAPELLRTFFGAQNATHLLISAEDMSAMTRAHWEALLELPAEDRELAGGNAIAAWLPADATVLHGHVLFHELLLPTLPFDRPEVLKVTWLRAPEHHVYSRYAFIQQVLMRDAPENWREPEFAEGVFRDILDGCNQPHFRNGQSRELSEMKLEAFDFVGIAEFFEQDLAQISALALRENR